MSDRHEYEGHLTTYYETGMEGMMGLILQDSRGITPNPDYDPQATVWPKNVPEWHSLSHSVWFRGGEEIEVYRKDGTVEFRGMLTKDRKAIAEAEYRFSFIPKEVPFETWISWFREERKAKAWSNEAPLVERMPDAFKK